MVNIGCCNGYEGKTSASVVESFNQDFKFRLKISIFFIVERDKFQRKWMSHRNISH